MLSNYFFRFSEQRFPNGIQILNMFVNFLLFFPSLVGLSGPVGLFGSINHSGFDSSNEQISGC